MCRAICDEHTSESALGCTEVLGKVMTVCHTTEERSGYDSLR